MPKEKEGFTLIEMLVVIAVVGILSATVLTALGPARTKAKDARIITALRQATIIAESLYDGTYSALPTSGSEIAEGDPSFGPLVKDIKSQGGGFVKVLHSGGSTSNVYYLFWSKLASGGYYCVDSSGRALTINSEPNSTDFACPQGSSSEDV